MGLRSTIIDFSRVTVKYKIDQAQIVRMKNSMSEFFRETESITERERVREKF